MRNIPQNIEWKIGRNYHLHEGHPICTVKQIIYRAMIGFTFFDEISPLVSIKSNFDDLLVPLEHPSRKPSDTYYSDKDHCLRTHTTAHTVDLLRAGERKFLVTGDVYRKDAVDPTHYPIFHQMEGVSLINTAINESQDSKDDLTRTVNGILRALFPGATPIWKPDSFPFTEGASEVSIDLNGTAVPVLGCGILKPEVLKNAGLTTWKGWAFRLGLDRLAMKLFNIPDIRLFWSDDQRFVSQFKAGEISPFKPFSEHPACFKDISFWIPAEAYEENGFFEVVRNIAGDLVEEIKLLDTFEKEGRTSKTYRVSYRSIERLLTDLEVNELHERTRMATKRCCFVELR
jgi:phenylalanyl-tRNA synthetase alpha chain